MQRNHLHEEAPVPPELESLQDYTQPPSRNVYRTGNFALTVKINLLAEIKTFTKSQYLMNHNDLILQSWTICFSVLLSLREFKK